MPNVCDIMTDQVIKIESSISINKATQLMLDEDVSSLMVVDENDRMIGILTESTALAVALDVQRRNDPVSLHMHRQFVKVAPNQPIEDAIDQSIFAPNSANSRGRWGAVGRIGQSS